MEEKNTNLENPVIIKRKGLGLGKNCIALSLVLLPMVFLLPGPALAAKGSPPEIVEYEAGYLRIWLRDDADAKEVSALHQRHGIAIEKSMRQGRQQLLRLPDSMTVEQALKIYRHHPLLQLVEPKYESEPDVLPTDPDFQDETTSAFRPWGLHNDGRYYYDQDATQPIRYTTADVDINAPEAWDHITGDDDAVVVVIDSGVDYNHEDLAESMWVNSLEIPNNNIDDDNNGYIDDVHGINAHDSSGNVMDTGSHGTQVAGVIAARANNGIGTSGVLWRGKILACRALNAQAVERCADYIVDLKQRSTSPVNIVAVNYSRSSVASELPEYSKESYANAVRTLMDAGILFVTTASNGGDDYLSDDIDDPVFQRYPAVLDFPNMIVTAASTYDDNLAPFSNYGRQTVHLSAPGRYIHTTTPGNGYIYRSGTSFAAPMVAAGALLLKAQDPTRVWHELRNLLLAGGKPPVAASGTTASATTVAERRLRLWDSDGTGAMTCAGQRVRARIRPIAEQLEVVTGQAVNLSMINIDCARGAGEIQISVDNGEVLTLRDDGLGYDHFAGDGVYSAQWLPQNPGSYQLAFAAGDVVNVTVNAAPSLAVSAGADVEGEAGQNIPLQAVVTMGNASLQQPLSYQWRQISGPQTGLVGSATATPYVFNPTAETLLEYEVTVSDALGGEASDRVRVSVRSLPVLSVTAGSDVRQIVYRRVDLDAAVTLNRSDIQEPLQVQWLQLSGTTVALHQGDSLSPYFYAPGSGPQTLSFRLTVSDGVGNVESDDVQVHVLPYPQLSVAAGDDIAVYTRQWFGLAAQASVELPEFQQPLTYQWRQLSGPAISIADPSAAEILVRAPLDGPVTLEFEVKVTDALSRIARDKVKVTVKNRPPIARAGKDQYASSYQVVRLDGSGSYDIDGRIVRYYWRQVAGPEVTFLTSPYAAVTHVRMPFLWLPSLFGGDAVFRLYVQDDDSYYAVDEVVIRPR